MNRGCKHKQKTSEEWHIYLSVATYVFWHLFGCVKSSSLRDVFLWGGMVQVFSWQMGSQFPSQPSNLCLLHWKVDSFLFFNSNLILFIYLRSETEMNIFNKGYSSQRRQTARTIIHLKKKQRYIKQKSEDMEGKSKNILSQ